METNQLTLTAETIDETSIILLADEASQAGDDIMHHVAQVALGIEAPIATAEQWEERYGGGGFSSGHMAGCLQFDSVDAARAECARVIGEARAQEDSAIG